MKSNACCGVRKLAYSQDLREAAADIPRDPAAQGLCGMAGWGGGQITCQKAFTEHLARAEPRETENRQRRHIS